jgi:hypothetical protein
MGGAAMPEFKATWAFVLEPVDGHRTRLLERFRVATPTPTPGQRFMLPLMGLGVFLMTRKQMLGIKDRAERWSVAPVTGKPAAAEEPAPGATPMGGDALSPDMAATQPQEPAPALA